jgi:hypothetical protein
LYISILTFLVDDLLQLYEISVLPFGCNPVILHPFLLAILLRSIQDRSGQSLPAAGFLRGISPALLAILKVVELREMTGGDLRVPIAARQIESDGNAQRPPSEGRPCCLICRGG